ncbi:Nn.00g042560.m01.CDS01 [Neocucurbitaria sp. VM-36]
MSVTAFNSSVARNVNRRNLLCEELRGFYNRLKDKRVFTKNVLEHNAKQIVALTRPTSVIELMGMDGDISGGYDFIEFMGIMENSRTDIRFFTYLDLGISLQEWVFNTVWDISFDQGNVLIRLMDAKIPIYTVPVADVIMNPPLSSALRPEEGTLKERESVCKLLTSGLQEVSKTVEIKKIDKPGVDPKEEARLNFDQNVVAFDVAEALKENYETKEPVLIIFSDPKYKKVEEDTLNMVAKERNLLIKFVNIPQALLEVDEHTVVLAHGNRSLPLRQLVVDLTYPFKGPAGFFCRTIIPVRSVEGELAAVREFRPDPLTRRVVSMETDYNMKSVCTVSEWKSTLYLKLE